MFIIGRGRYARATYPRAYSGLAPIIQSVPFDFGTIDPGTASFSIPVPGARPGMALLVNPTDTLSNLIFFVHFHVDGTDSVNLVVYNIDGAPIIVGEEAFLYTLFSSVNEFLVIAGRCCTLEVARRSEFVDDFPRVLAGRTEQQGAASHAQASSQSKK